MGTLYEPTPKQIADWNEWVASRPPVVRGMAEKLPPWNLYRMESGHRVIIYSFNEDGTVTVAVLGKFNLVKFERRVFGIDPDELVVCERPAPDEPVGSVMTQDEVNDNIDALRCEMAPDLWEMGQGGKAIWKGEGECPPDPRCC